MYQYQESSLKINYGNDVIFSVDDMKKHLRVTGNSEDSLIEIYIKAATRYVENYTRLLLAGGTSKQVFFSPTTMDNKQFFSLAIGNATAVTSITCNTVDNLTAEFAITSDWTLVKDTNKPRVYAPEGLEFAGNVAPHSIAITYTAGFTECEIPPDIKVAIMLVCADMYENRMDSVKQLPTAAEILLSPYVVNQGV
jgi:uncharacterized phiE125 gp8 family phage protein